MATTCIVNDTLDLHNLATDSKPLGSHRLGYKLCDIIVVYLVRNQGNDYPQFGNLWQDHINLL